MFKINDLAPAVVEPGLQLNLRKAPPKPPRGPNSYTQEKERRARQTQHLHNVLPAVYFERRAAERAEVDRLLQECMADLSPRIDMSKPGELAALRERLGLARKQE